ncbi:MAG TPA: GH25 family lysozyme [Oculatellaceae cyanobacterium]
MNKATEISHRHHGHHANQHMLEAAREHMLAETHSVRHREHHEHREHQHQLSGIDVSHYQGNIHCDKVRAAHPHFVYVKATEGANNEDERFHSNWHGVRESGLTHGAYHIFNPSKSAHSQVTNFLHTIGRMSAGDLPPMLDLEKPHLWSHNHHANANKVVAWLREVKEKLHVTPILYMSPTFSNILGHDSRLKEFPLWVAAYQRHKPAAPAPFRHYRLWQYTQTGHQPGIHAFVDRDYFYGSTNELERMKKA